MLSCSCKRRLRLRLSCTPTVICSYIYLWATCSPDQLNPCTPEWRACLQAYPSMRCRRLSACGEEAEPSSFPQNNKLCGSGFSCAAQIKSEPGPDGSWELWAFSFLRLTVRRPFLPRGTEQRWATQRSRVLRGESSAQKVSAPGSRDRKWPGSLEVIKPLIWYHRDRTQLGYHCFSLPNGRLLLTTSEKTVN